MGGMARRLIAILLSASALVTACTQSPAARPPESSSVSPPPSEPAPVGLDVVEVADGLEHAWDVGFLPDGKLLVTERSGRLRLLSSGDDGAEMRTVQADFSDVYDLGEGGLMGVAVHPDFAKTREFTTCQTHQEDGEPKDVRLVTWRLSEDGTRAVKVKPLVTGLPINESGRHSGCRPVVTKDGALLVGTGDSADPDVPQDKTSLGGKVLRIDPETGKGLSNNPFANSDNANTRRIVTYGHRNIQGIAVQPGTDRVYVAEHGPDIDDEVNLVEFGRNYGWDPSQGGTVDSYDESVPMTDRERFPNAMRPAWTSGDMTEAICGATFLSGERWGALDGTLAVVALKGSKLILLTIGREGGAVGRSDPPELDEEYGRLRAARTGPDGALYITTSNGEDDKLLRVTPEG
ncbi:MAG: PQQ-dependent sugar dehydrogenase [Actinophytocola sp.]|nr:PQQ-dependent sugar dehydrogenase [Actinophytocola sp.]